MLRGLLSLAFVVLAALIMWGAFHLGSESRWADLFLNLGTELIGIVATVAIVDWLFERRRKSEAAKGIAWEVIHDIDHAVWVWQGGRREFDLEELLSAIQSATESCPLPPFTQNLFLRIGSRADNTMRTRAEIISVSPSLSSALFDLSLLTTMRDLETPIAPVTVKAIVVAAVRNLVIATDRQIPALTDAVGTKLDSSEVAQRWRHYGEKG